MYAMLYLADKVWACFISVSAYGYYKIPFLVKVLLNIFGGMFGNVNPDLMHCRYSLRINSFGRMSTSGTNIKSIIK